MGKFADDAGETWLAEPFFHGQQHFLGGAGFEIDDPIRDQPDAGEAGGKEGRKQAAAGVAPEHRPRKARDEAGREQSSRAIRRAACDFVQGTKGKAAAGQMRIDCGEAEREHLATALSRPFEPLDAGAEEGEAHVLILFSPSEAVKFRGPSRPPQSFVGSGSERRDIFRSAADERGRQ